MRARALIRHERRRTFIDVTRLELASSAATRRYFPVYFDDLAFFDDLAVFCFSLSFTMRRMSA